MGGKAAHKNKAGEAAHVARVSLVVMLALNTQACNKFTKKEDSGDINPAILFCP
jgi:hypothetical protein